MDGPAVLMLFGAGLAGGVVTAVVGGASLITFPALLAAGLPALVANASNTVALTPGNFVGALADLERRPRWNRSFVSVMTVCVGGSAAGAALLLLTPERAFKNLLAGLTSLVAVLVFVSRGMVAWPETLIMMGGALVGGFLGGRLARVLPPRLVRGIVIAVGTLLTVIYAWRYWVPR